MRLIRLGWRGVNHMLKNEGKGANVKIEVIGFGRCKVFINGHEIPGIVNIDTENLIKRDSLCLLSLQLAIASLEIVGAREEK